MGQILSKRLVVHLLYINPIQKFLVDASGNLTAGGDLDYNGSTSLTTQVATLNGYKTSGTFSATTTFQTIFNFSGTRGFITMIGSGANTGMLTCFFEATYGQSFSSLTQIACSGSAAQALLNTTNSTSAGTQTVFAQQPSSGYAVQAKVSTTCTLYWYVTYL